MMIPVHATVDVVALANVASFIESNGQRVKSKSQVLSFAIAMVNESTFGKANRFTDEQSALDYLARLDIGFSAGNKQQAKALNRLASVVVPTVRKDIILSDDEAMRQTAFALANQCNENKRLADRAYHSNPDETVSPEKKRLIEQQNYDEYVCECNERGIKPMSIREYMS